MTTVYITDDHPLVVEGIKNVLSNTDDLQLMGCFSNAEATLSALKASPVDVLLLDINLPDANGIELIQQLRDTAPELCIIALSIHNEYAVINSMLREGANGYIQKNTGATEIIEGIRSVCAGNQFLCSQTKEIIQKKKEDGLQNVPKLTRREKEIIALVARGLTTTQIADQLFISPHTVESHRKNLMEKFQVNNVTSALKLAIEYGLVRP